jgi:hypothetical protein
MLKINIEKAKAIGHDVRRNARAAEFAPLDEQIAKAIPGVDVKKVEAQRKAIRSKYDDVQIAIDGATTPDEIKAALVRE